MDPKTRPNQPIAIGVPSEGKQSQSDMLAGEPHPKRRADLNYRTIEGETVILDRKEGHLHQLNPTASFIWDICDGNSSVAEIIDRIVGTYEVDSGTARRDVEEVLLKLRNSHLLETS
jgi:Coenzyme PQQ synthesis protein D (PqqD)